jgi:hypothetical protein
MKLIVHSNFGLSIDHNFNKQVEVWVDDFSGVENSSAEVKIFAQIEPNEIMGLNQTIIEKSRFFDYVFTYETEVIKSINNAVLFEYGTKWIDIDQYEFKEKEFSVSTVCGHKVITKNHQLRQKLWYKQNNILMPKKFFLSRLGGVENFNNNPILGEKKEPLFDSMFHICIENVTKENFFTEKLIDCFLCKSIPIYIGCPNINEYFNADGFFIVKDFNEVIELCNKLTPEDYYSRINIVEENRNKALNWFDYNQRLINKIEQII